MRKCVLLSIAVCCTFFSSVSAADQEPKIRAELVSPVPDSEAQRMQSVSFRPEETLDNLPLLVVRSAEPNSPWWVQERLLTTAEGELTGTAWIGNATTPAGSRFYLRLVVPKDESARADLKRGVTLKDLSTFWSSKSFSLTTGQRATPEAVSVPTP